MSTPRQRPAAKPHAGSVRSVMYASSPLLASKTPPWRSKFLVALVGASFCVLLGRALYVQVIDAPFFQRQGEARYARTLELPASRGRITDRNGLILAASVPGALDVGDPEGHGRRSRRRAPGWPRRSA